MKKVQIFLTLLSFVLLAACGNNQSKQKGAKAPETSKDTVSEAKPAESKLLFDPATLDEEPVLAIETSEGTIVVKLYKDTPKHRDNFLKLASEGFYDGVIFHRVISDFMIQTGDPDSKNPTSGARYGSGGPGYTVPAEILPNHKHKKGALAAARKGDNVNPNKESSGSQFYIVQNAGGTPHLDGGYTVFGETIKGLDVVDKIGKTATDENDRPVKDIFIVSIKPVLE